MLLERLKAKKKAEQLIALALSTHSQEEARTAAFTAVQLIRRYDFQLSFVEGQPAVPVQPTEPEVSKPRWIYSKYPGTCLKRFEPFFVDDRVFWYKGKGCVCEKCVKNGVRL
jgi:hypothetical protein